MDIHRMRYLKPWPQASVEHPAPAVPASGDPPKHAPHAAPTLGAGTGDVGYETQAAYDAADTTLSSVDGKRLPDAVAGPGDAPSAEGYPGPARPHLDTPPAVRISGGITWN